MGGNHRRQASSRLAGGLKGSAGEIVEVHGGHIVRSIGRKDRHSKVCTAKGPRDRRVRLSAHTAIQFYDVQDRLGYDRPSKAVDWLIKKAKAAIDELAKLPAWNPLVSFSAINNNTHHRVHDDVEAVVDCTQKRAEVSTMARKEEEVGGGFGEVMGNANEGGFLGPSMDSDAIADTIKSFFPVVGSAAVTTTTSSSITNTNRSSMLMQFQRYPPPAHAPEDLLSRTTCCQSQDLRLSLHSFADPTLLHHQHHSHHQNQQGFFSAANAASLGFDAAAVAAGGWSEDQSSDISRYQRMVGWNTGSMDSGGGGGGEGFVFASPPPPPPLLQPLFCQSDQLYSQRGPLQSSNAPSICAWLDPSIFAATAEHHYQQTPPPAMMINNHPSLISGIGFSSDRCSGFQIPARIRGDEEEHDGTLNKPSSASSDSLAI